MSSVTAPVTMRWRDAMAAALYGPSGFFVTAAPAAHFRTSVHASPLFARALAALLVRVDRALGQPAALDVVDVGAGRGELLAALPAHLPAALSARLRSTAVERAPRPAGLDPTITWQAEVPEGVTGLLVATEWLDNVPIDVAVDLRYLLVDPRTGMERPGPPVNGPDREWLDRWWPAEPGARIEIGRPRDLAWASAVARVAHGLALAVDYGHLRQARPFAGTLTGFRDGREVPPVPDGAGDLTAHVALDSAGTLAARRTGGAWTLLTQREALHALGVSGARPPLSGALTDPSGYVRALALASQAAELTDPGGLGGHHWLLNPVGLAATDLFSAAR